MVSIREFVAHLPPDKRELLAAPARLLPVKRRYGPIYERTIREIEKARTTPSWVRETVDGPRRFGRRVKRRITDAVSTMTCWTAWHRGK